MFESSAGVADQFPASARPESNQCPAPIAWVVAALAAGDNAGASSFGGWVRREALRLELAAGHARVLSECPQSQCSVSARSRSLTKRSSRRPTATPPSALSAIAVFNAVPPSAFGPRRGAAQQRR
jgi:hypothetical protein